MSDSPEFVAAVEQWMKAQGVHATKVLAVSSYGTDWAGDTESGFHSEFEVTITYLDASGAKQYRDVTGGDMDALWNMLILGYGVSQPNSDTHTR